MSESNVNNIQYNTPPTPTSVAASPSGVNFINTVTGNIGSAIDSAVNSGAQRNTTLQQNITFPSDLLSNDQKYYIQFRFQKYQRRAYADQATAIPITTPSGIGSIQLPIPDNLSDDTRANYDTPSSSRAVGLIAEQLLKERNNISGSTNSLLSSIRESISSVINNPTTSNLQGMINSGLASAGLQNGTNLSGEAASIATSYAITSLMNTAVGRQASILAGIQANPFQSVLFNSVEFKTHNFRWKLMPRSPEESDLIKQIIRTFQYHMLPSLSPNNAYLLFGYPSIAMVSLNPSDEYLYKIRPCVIQSFTAHYNSSGIPAFYKGGKGAPGSVDISVGLKEIELWTSDNYASANRITQGPDISTSNLGVGATR